METKEEKLARFVEAIQWAMIPANKDGLPDDLKQLVELIGGKVAELKKLEDSQKQPVKFTYNLNGFTLTLPNYTRGAPNAEIQG